MKKYILPLGLVFSLFQGSFCASLLEFSLMQQKGKAEFQCPNSELGFYPADDLCSASYYTCVGGDAFLQECPGTTVFDPLVSTCVEPDIASCAKTTTMSTTTAFPYTCPTPNGFFPVPETCGSDYIICVNGAAAISTCPFEAIFDPVTYECTPPDQASCTQPFTCPSPDGDFPYPGACSGIYYTCTAGQSTLQYCPGGSVFDPAVSSCVLNENASCIPGSGTTAMTTVTPTTPDTFVCPDNGYYPNPNNCSVYWICNNGNAFLAPCADGLVFNPNTNYCDFPENVPECSTTQSILVQGTRYGGSRLLKAVPLANHESPFMCTNDFPLSDGNLVGTFSSYYACIDGVAYPKACPGNTVFDPKKLRCVLGTRSTHRHTA